MSYFTCNETFSFDLSSWQNRNKFNYFKINSKAAERLFFPRLFCDLANRKVCEALRSFASQGSKKGFAERLRMRAERRAQSIQSEAKYGLNSQPKFVGYGWYGVVASIEACGAKTFLFSKKRKVYSQSKRENSNLDCALQRALGPGSTPGTGPQTNSISGLLHHH